MELRLLSGDESRGAGRRRAVLAAASVLLGLALLGLGACGGEERRPSREATGPVQSYTVRGAVVTLPGPERPPGRITIRHEAIPDFVGPSGKVVGMGAMAMDFQLAEGVSAVGLVPGEPILFTFEVDWSSDSLPLVVRVEALPAVDEPGPAAAQPEASAQPETFDPTG